MRAWRRALTCLVTAAPLALIGAAPEIAAANPTATAVNCTPAAVYLGSTTACRATVSDIAEENRTTPVGTVSLSTNPPNGSFSPGPSCVLGAVSSTAASCQVTYTPCAPGEIQVSGAYGGNATHEPSAQTFFLTVFDSTFRCPIPPGTTSVVANPGVCGTLRQRLKAAKRRGDKPKVRKLRRKLRRLGC